jgi:dTDP-glucose 4,6-dehydratase
MLAMTRILVTGGLGFIGSNFIRFLLSETDYNIINIDNLSYGSNPKNLDDLEGAPRYRFVKGDISDPDLTVRLVNESDAVVNFAAETHVDRSISDSLPFHRTNVGGVLTILEAIRKADRDVRLVQIGTDESYGDITEGSFTESDRLTPSSPYSASKASADLYVMAYRRTYGLNACITRCTNNYGPYQFPEKLIPKTIIRAKMGLKVPIYGTGKNVRDWIYVLDHCEGVKAVLEKVKPGEIYNISSDNELDNLTIVKSILRILKLPESFIEFVDDRPGHDLRYSLDSQKIREELGWLPTHTFEKGISETVSWYLSNDKWWKPLSNERTLNPTPWKLKW